MSADTAAKPSLLRRQHTILGVCEAIGEDFGFNPVILRVAFAGGLYFSPIGVIGLYLGLGLAVALSRWLYPVPSATPAAATPALASSANSDDEQLRSAA
jgi:phage shock protein PspC (stress-responsive transcriptional regulator)